MKVILSIKPEFVEKIIKGEKQFEFRRKLFNKEVESVIVYASSPLKRVVGEFTIAEILNYELDILWNKTKGKSGIRRRFFYEYFKGLKKGYAIKIKNFYSFKTPLRLEEFGILTAPQSFIYFYDSKYKLSKQGNIFRTIQVVSPKSYNYVWGNETDQLVYNLYKLTEEEIEVIENKK
ncbi:hypothetical protein P0M35_12090 [Melioribacteraceae bacterium 09-Me]|uniref:ASCH domain-containing protein n=1 Tax=Stygiobacter electus TaxID=3032292 RepID=A0AAE3P4M6_9BACT|nr:hypothetical protein [Stygiobacter electus]MDF1612895.1 hypothetical protein [Stygiobacter electus]